MTDVLSDFEDIAILTPKTNRLGQTPPREHQRTQQITKIDMHCTATPGGHPVTWEAVERYHQQTRGWWMGAYHYLVHIDGTITMGLPHEWVGWSATGANADGISVCYVGGITSSGRPRDTRTAMQRRNMFRVVRYIQLKYNVADNMIFGHNELANKACPSFPEDENGNVIIGAADDDYRAWREMTTDFSENTAIGDGWKPTEAPAKPQPIVRPVPVKEAITADELTGLLRRARRGDKTALSELEKNAPKLYNELKGIYF